MKSLDKVALVDIGLSNYCGKILLQPFLCGHVLLKDHHLLKSHLFELFRIFQYNSGQNIKTETKVVVLNGKVSVE